MLDLILAAVLTAQNPDISPVCFVSGEVYSSPTETQAALTSTNCPIRIQQEGRVITMVSPKWVVQVLIPEGIGKQEFLYQWGQAEARIGDQDVQVTYKPVGAS